MGRLRLWQCRSAAYQAQAAPDADSQASQGLCRTRSAAISSVCVARSAATSAARRSAASTASCSYLHGVEGGECRVPLMSLRAARRATAQGRAVRARSPACPRPPAHLAAAASWAALSSWYRSIS